MRAAALVALLLWQAGAGNQPPIAHPDAMQYMRAIRVASGPAADAGAGQACAVLDASIFPHAAPSLADLRIFPSGDPDAREIPYAITMSEAVTEEAQPARVLNLGGEKGRIAFDLEMPARAYTSVTLKIDPAVHDFLATATMTGMNALGGAAKSTALGTFTLFDLSSQHLSRDTTLPLDESTFRYLHIALRVTAAAGAAGSGSTEAAGFQPAMIQGAQVPPSREAQILYTPIAETARVRTVGRETVATFEIPARVPVEWIDFTLAPDYKGNFSRDVRVTAVTEPPAKGAAGKTDSDGALAGADTRAPLTEVVSGSILRVHANEAGREIRTDQLGFPAILGANLQRPAKVEVAIENGDDQPLPIAQVGLEMRQRKICFDAESAPSGLGLYYGDPRLAAPVYDYERLFVASSKARTAELGPEMLNPAYRPPPESQRPFTERHPELLWLALIVAICALGMVALKASRNVGR